jgi:hypothetical protein
LKKSSGKEEFVTGEKSGVGSRKWKSRYDLTRKYQLEWAAKAPWSEALLKDDGLIHQVHCKTCSAMGKKDVVVAPKWDTIFKHGLCDCHKKRTMLYAARQPTSVLEQIQGCNTVESRWKRVQFATLFAILSAGRPMQEYRGREELCQFLNVPKCPSMHWYHGSGWLMAEHIYDFVKTKQRSMVQAAAFISLSIDETSAVDNSSIIVVHCYVMSNWGRQALMVALMKMESTGATSDSLTRVIINALSVNCALDEAAIASKLLCFGTDGVATFQG